MTDINQENTVFLLWIFSFVNVLRTDIIFFPVFSVNRKPCEFFKLLYFV